ncbi:NAD(P)-dependent oxidoreductase [Massilia sp. CCM 8734]|uniref:NAD(P)-dependent oxidoreductase n=1 Tax=Massilia sp. CCM 8734 TaxID=2609283 RepID=UPI00141E9E73|nr:NAD(P)-dependent oxidoreductase [Massilia sp. CCM 8734]NHZ99921.1 NAD-binding protein [Massilia sp. CCM 8734]
MTCLKPHSLPSQEAALTTLTIAFLGIGLMGHPMAICLAGAGWTVRAWNRSPDKAEALRPAGVQPCTGLDEAVRTADIVISMLASGAVVSEVIDAALPSLHPGALWIDMSSTQHGEALAFHARLAARQVRFLDAPVSGGVAGAQAGSLAIMAGAALDDFAQAEPVLRAMGRPTLVGPAGSGQVAKLCNQLIVGGTLNIVAEALLLAQAAGADPAAVRSAIRGGFAESRILDLHGQRMLDRNFIPGGQVTSQLKDLQNVLVAAADAGLVLPLTSVVTANYRSIADEFARADHAAALLALEKMNPGQRLGTAPDQLPPD